MHSWLEVVDDFLLDPNALAEESCSIETVAGLDGENWRYICTKKQQSPLPRLAGDLLSQLDAWLGPLLRATEVISSASVVRAMALHRHARCADVYWHCILTSPDHRWLREPPTPRMARSMGHGDVSEFTDQVIAPDVSDLSTWDEIGRMGPVYNRLVLFRGSEFDHAPLGGCGSSLEYARLTHIFFSNEVPRLGGEVRSVPVDDASRPRLLS